MLETNRVAYWWANRMVASPRPLQEKMALFWHGHFASNEAKVRDYRKLLGQLELFQKQGTGNFRDLTVAVAQDPAMLSFLDAGVNVKGASNENFAREIMELFTMGVGHYTEKDIREAARAFTGWNYVDVKFVVNKDQHDDGEKTFLGKTGRFDGVDMIDIIMQQPVTAEYIAGKIYRYFVRQELSPELQKQLGAVLRRTKYEIPPLLEKIFLSRDFYSPASVGTRNQEPGGTGDQHLQEAGPQERSRRSGLQLRHRRAGPATVLAADGGRMGRRPELDHARPVAGARQFRPRRSVSRYQLPSAGPLHRRRRNSPRGRAHPPGNGHQRRRQGRDQEVERWRNRTGTPTATRISTPAMAASAARKWPSRGSSRFRATPRKSISPKMVMDAKSAEHHAGSGLHDSALHARPAGRRRTRRKLVAFLNKNWAPRTSPWRKPIWSSRCGWLLHLIMSQPEYQFG